MAQTLPKPPADWTDEAGWDSYFQQELHNPSRPLPTVRLSVRFLAFVQSSGGRVWFPGCGLDAGPRAYAVVGCQALASDFSSVAVARQKVMAAVSPEELFEDWASVPGEQIRAGGNLLVEKHDFTRDPSPGAFDVVINCRAFQGLDELAMRAAARNFRASLRPGGALIVDTMNVQGGGRDRIENALAEAGFFVPFLNSEQWYRNELANTGIVHAMILGRPIIPHWGQYPQGKATEFERRDQAILASFRPEYECRRQQEAAEVETVLADGQTVAAHVVYSTG